jgi:hypothetical protein
MRKLLRAKIMDTLRKPPAGALGYPKKAEYKYPGQNCAEAQFS